MSDELQMLFGIGNEELKVAATTRDVEDVVRIVHDMALFVVLATCRKELDAGSRIRRVDLARHKDEFHDLVADFGGGTRGSRFGKVLEEHDSLWWWLLRW